MTKEKEIYLLQIKDSRDANAPEVHNSSYDSCEAAKVQMYVDILRVVMDKGVKPFEDIQWHGCKTAYRQRREQAGRNPRPSYSPIHVLSQEISPATCRLLLAIRTELWYTTLILRDMGFRGVNTQQGDKDNEPRKSKVNR